MKARMREGEEKRDREMDVMRLTNDQWARDAERAMRSP
jgi:hypothetical protein